MKYLDYVLGLFGIIILICVSPIISAFIILGDFRLEYLESFGTDIREGRLLSEIQKNFRN